MAPPKRAIKAMDAMKDMKFPVHVVKPILKRLLEVFDNNWDYIESDNYSVLVDALVNPPNPQAQEDDDSKKKKKKQEEVEEEEFEDSSSESEQIQTRMKMKRTPDVAGETSGKRLRIEPEVPSGSQFQRRRLDMPSQQFSRETVVERLATQQPSFIKKISEAGPSQPPCRSERAELAPLKMNSRDAVASSTAQENSVLNSAITNRSDKQSANERLGSLTRFKEPKVEPGLDVHGSQDEPYHDEVPLAMIPAPIPRLAASESASASTSTREKPVIKQAPLARNAPTGETNVPQLQVTRNTHKENKNENGSLQVSPASVDVASSSSGEVKLSFTCSTNQPDFHMPNMEEVFKVVEDRCLRSYKILQPNFSLMNLMTEMCQCVLELGSESALDKRENFVNVIPMLDSLKKPGLHGLPGFSSNGSRMPPMENELNMKLRRSLEAAKAVSNSLVRVHQPQLALGGVRPLHDANDVSKGEERVRIPIANDFDRETLPPSFNYIPNNIVHQNAYLNFSLARIGDEDCCSDCFGDCMAAPIPCACARETGGEFAYTSDGLLNKQFLDTCISMNQNPEKHSLFYCKICPLERIKNEVEPDSCKGHLIRKFIKECWSKCGCNKQCGNRVVQRGITRNLEVFFTGERKGWGVRSLDDLPRGAFVYEYVGEILTNMELFNRTMQTTGNARHTYPVLLDADWGTEGVLKDEEALCLDATFYGNVARFVNHRCNDANLIEIPVEVETPDRHYYHLAFFTTRKIEAYEELTWDYGIDFDDEDHPIKAFRCRCRSKYCRDIKRKGKGRKRMDED